VPAACMRGRYVVSDEHAGLEAAIQRNSRDAANQRCQVHYLCEALNRVMTSGCQHALLAGLHYVRASRTRPEAERRGQQLIARLRGALLVVAMWLEEALGETLVFLALQEAEARRHLHITNAVEREHDEVRRHTRVIRIFPNEVNSLRLATVLTADSSDQWAKRRYIIPASLTHPLKVILRTARAA
jgi:putative transposase